MITQNGFQRSDVEHIPASSSVAPPAITPTVATATAAVVPAVGTIASDQISRSEYTVYGEEPKKCIPSPAVAGELETGGASDSSAMG